MSKSKTGGTHAGKTGKKGRRLGGAEQRLWTSVMQDVRPLAPPPSMPTHTVSEAQSQSAGDESAPVYPVRVDDRKKNTPDRAPQHEHARAGESRSAEAGKGTGQSVTTNRRTARRLRSGRMEIEGRIDLHGMSRLDAHDALRRYLVNAHAAGKRTILVITGIGRRSAPEPQTGFQPGFQDEPAPAGGVIRRALPEWLAAPPLDSIVLDYAQARKQHGGAGAYYVLLRRSRGR